MITASLASDLSDQIFTMDIPLVYKTDAINAIQVIRMELDKTEPGRHRITMAANTLSRLVPAALDCLFEADPGLAGLVTIGGEHDSTA